MNTEDLKQIFQLIEQKRGYRPPLKWLLLNSPEDIPEDLTEDELYIEGDLDLRNTKIKSLPKGLKVEWTLNVSNTPIDFLPDDLTVGGHLILSYTSIKSLPKGLKVGWDLVIYNTPIESLPDDLEIGEYIFVNKEELKFFEENYPQYTFRIKVRR